MNKGKPFARPSPFPFSARKYASSLLCQALPFKKTFFRFRRPGTKSIRRFPPLSVLCSPRNLFYSLSRAVKKGAINRISAKFLFFFCSRADRKHVAFTAAFPIGKRAFLFAQRFLPLRRLHFPRSRCGFPFRRPHAFLLSFRFPSSERRKTAVFAAAS